MKNKFFKYYLTAFYFCSTCVIFAFPGSDSNNNGIDDNGTADATPGAPIDDYFWVLIAIGMLVAFVQFRKIYKQSNIEV